MESCATPCVFDRAAPGQISLMRFQTFDVTAAALGALIPSTWAFTKTGLYATGHNPPNQEPEDAFMATGLLMADNGADKQTYADGWPALSRRLGATKSAYAFTAMMWWTYRQISTPNWHY